MIRTKVAVNVVVGATGAGKTTIVRRLLTQRKREERWTVLVNDFGAVTMADAPGVAENDVVVREIGVCVCCSARVGLRTALVSLLRTEKPHRLIIEASAAAEPASIFRVLREPGIAGAVDVRSTLGAADAKQLVDPRYSANATYRAQLAASAILVLTHRETTDENALREALVDMVSPGTTVLDTVEQLGPTTSDWRATS
jgi:G3E family GTPase